MNMLQDEQKASCRNELLLLLRPRFIRLALSDEFPLCFRHISEQLQHDICNQNTGQIMILPGIQQGHIHHNDIRFLFPCDDTPLIQ